MQVTFYWVTLLISLGKSRTPSNYLSYLGIIDKVVKHVHPAIVGIPYVFFKRMSDHIKVLSDYKWESTILNLLIQFLEEFSLFLILNRPIHIADFPANIITLIHNSDARKKLSFLHL
jgi:hypothetical protein